MILEITAFALLLIPTIYELWDDRHGETLAEKRRDVYIRIALLVVFALLSSLVRTFDQGIIWVAYLQALLMSFALFFMIFDYAINIILDKPDPFSYLSKSPLDQLWAHWHPGWRFALRIAVLAVALIIYL